MPARGQACRPQRGRVGAGAWHRRSLAHSWKVNHARRGTTATSPRSKPKAPPPGRGLIELVPTVSSAKLAGGGRYVLEIAGARVEFGDDCAVTTLRRVLEALRSC